MGATRNKAALAKNRIAFPPKVLASAIAAPLMHRSIDEAAKAVGIGAPARIAWIKIREFDLRLAVARKLGAVAARIGSALIKALDLPPDYVVGLP